jgi:Right handed beta helix region
MPPIRSGSLVVLALVLSLGLAGVASVWADDGPKVVAVRCDKGKTISDALAEHQGPVTIEVAGVCDEHVVIDRDDVSLVAGAAGAGIHGPDASRHTVLVTGHRFTLDGLALTGGRNALVVSGSSRVQVRNCSVRAGGTGIVGGIGILFFQGASGTVDTCEATGNPADGIMLDGAVAIVTNNRLTANGRNGLFVFGGSTARVGLTSGFVPAPNVISDNGGNGIHVTQNSLALIFGNTITGNGTNPASPVGRFGVILFQSRADLIGRNTITGSGGPGLLLSASTGFLGDPGFGLPFDNVVRGNSTGGPSQGIQVITGSTIFIRNAIIDANNGAGLQLSEHSTATIVSSSVTGNTANGVQLATGSGVIFRPNLPVSVLAGNTGFDLKCLDAESSFTGPIAPGATIDCTGF